MLLREDDFIFVEYDFIFDKSHDPLAKAIFNRNARFISIWNKSAERMPWLGVLTIN